MFEPRRLIFITMLALACALNACGKSGDSHAKVAGDIVTQLKDVTSTLSTVTDKNSADAATSKINDASVQIDKIAERMRKLPPVTKEEDNSIRDTMLPQIQAIQSQLVATRTRLAGKADVLLSLQGPLAKLQQSMAGLGRPSAAAK
jgi:hypothetical protein